MEKRFLEVCIRNRNILGLTIEDVSDILDIRPTIYEQFEEGLVDLDEDTMRKVVKLYCLDIKEFKDYSNSYDLSEVPESILDITKSLLNMIEGDENA